MAGTAEKSRFQELLAVHVAGGMSIKDSAAAAGCSESHAYELSRHDSFKALVNQFRQQAIECALAQLTASAAKAVDTLRECLDCDAPAVRIQAAKALLNSLIPISEQFELRQRLEVLEQAQNRMTV